MSMFGLLKTKRFAGLFGTQFLGAFNDNMFKNAVALMVAFRAASEADAGMLVNLAGGLFILPFVMFSPVAGQIADKYDKAIIMRYVKLAEIPIMGIAGLGFFFASNGLLMTTIFLMGTQSAFFGPAKYSILPQHLNEDELTTGNGLISMSTFIAIILGLITATIFVSREWIEAIPLVIISIAGLGYLTSRTIPTAPATDVGLTLNYNFFKEVKSLWGYSKRVKSVHLSILGISWLWFIGSVVLTQMPALSKFVLSGTKDMSTMLTMTFVVGIAVGSFICIKLSRGEIELGLVPIGAFGMTLFGGDLLFIDYSLAQQGTLGLVEYVLDGNWSRWRLIGDLTLIGLSASLFVIPLNAMIQSRAEEQYRSRIISANNIMNAIFMVVAAVITMILYQMKLSTPEIFFVFFAMNFVVATFIFSVVPEFFLRFGCWILANSIYRITYSGRDHVPRHGGAVIVANHISFIDWFIITAACRRPCRFVMYHKIFKIPVLGLLFRLAKAIPIAPAKEDASSKERAFQTIKEELADNNLICIFPEGAITQDGELLEFRGGVEQILQESPVPVIPMALNGLWGSFFSRKKGQAMKGLPKPQFRKIHVSVGEPMPPETKATDLQKVIQAMLEDHRKTAGS
jgi:hypothetical protein